MSEFWTKWEGEVVNGVYPLHRFLDGSDHSAVFLTERNGKDPYKAAIKLVWTERPNFQGWACTECAWVFSPSWPLVGKANRNLRQSASAISAFQL